MKQVNILNIIAVLSILCVFSLYGQELAKKPEGNSTYSYVPVKGWNHGKLDEKLNLSEEQQEALTKLREEYNPLQKKSYEQLLEIRRKIQEELLKDNPDDAVLSNYSDELGALNTQISNDMIDHVLRLKEFLTKEQFQMVTEKFGHMGKGPGFKGRGRHKAKGLKGDGY